MILIWLVEFFCLNINWKYDVFFVIFFLKDKLLSSNDYIVYDVCKIVILFGTVKIVLEGEGER